MNLFLMSGFFLLLLICSMAVGFSAGFFCCGKRKKEPIAAPAQNVPTLSKQEKNIFGLKDWEYRNFMRYDGTENQEFDPENGDKE